MSCQSGGMDPGHVLGTWEQAEGYRGAGIHRQRRARTSPHKSLHERVRAGSRLVGPAQPRVTGWQGRRCPGEPDGTHRVERPLNSPGYDVAQASRRIDVLEGPDVRRNQNFCSSGFFPSAPARCASSSISSSHASLWAGVAARVDSRSCFRAPSQVASQRSADSRRSVIFVLPLRLQDCFEPLDVGAVLWAICQPLQMDQIGD